jgi:hypothetical protein
MCALQKSTKHLRPTTVLYYNSITKSRYLGKFSPGGSAAARLVRARKKISHISADYDAMGVVRLRVTNLCIQQAASETLSDRRERNFERF